MVDSMRIALLSLAFTALVANVLATLLASGAVAQDLGTLNPQPLPPLAHPDDPKTPAKEVFGREVLPSSGPAHVIGFYSNGCIAGATALPINGPTWQVMRLSRNRNWGHPNLVHFLERLSARAAKTGTWPGLLVGDMSQPRGGPMMGGHASHQVGLDADIWLSPMPPRELSRAEREEVSSIMVVADSLRDVDPKLWTPGHFNVIKAAASDPEVERIFVNPAIKVALCREAGSDRAWLEKVRPWWGHDYHFHVRIRCPADSPTCKPQPRATGGDGCGAELKSWFTAAFLNPPLAVQDIPRPGNPMSKLPPACRAVAKAPDVMLSGAGEAKVAH
jgi:penicillin-insensitive murein endopeptidase